MQRPLVQVMQKSTQSNLDQVSKRMEKTKIGILILIGALVAITVIVAISVFLVSGTIHLISYRVSYSIIHETPCLESTTND